jgi:hypothetical protein
MAAVEQVVVDAAMENPDLAGRGAVVKEALVLFREAQGS